MLKKHLRDAVARRICLSLFPRRLYHAVNCALNSVVAPSCEQVACVYYNCSLDGRSVYKLAGRALDLQTTPIILEE